MFINPRFLCNKAVAAVVVGVIQFAVIDCCRNLKASMQEKREEKNNEERKAKFVMYDLKAEAM